MKKFVAVLALLFAFSITAPVITLVFAEDKPAGDAYEKPAKKKGKKAKKKADKKAGKKEEKKEEAK